MKIARLLVLLIPLGLAAESPPSAPEPLSDSETIEWLELQLEVARTEAASQRRTAALCTVKLTAVEAAAAGTEDVGQTFTQLVEKRNRLQSKFARSRGIDPSAYQLQSDRTWIAIQSAAPTQASGEAASRQGSVEGPEEP